MSRSNRPDLAIVNATIFTGRTLLEEASCVVVRNGKISAIGTETELQTQIQMSQQVLDAKGGLLTPGFVDAHVHASFAGHERLTCDVSGVGKRAGYRNVIQNYAATVPEGEWITGAGWSMSRFPGGTPSAAELDEIVADKPVYLVNRDHHGAWVNSKALALAGIDAGTTDPADGRIERLDNGLPQGTLHEGAMELMSTVLPTPSTQQMTAGILEAQRYLVQRGVTGWHEAIVGDYGGYPDVGPAYADALSSGQLRALVTGALWLKRPEDDDAASPGAIAEVVRDLVARREANAASGFRTDTVKIMVDGVIENESAALDEQYLSSRCNCGLEYFGAEYLQAVVPALIAAGFNLHFHVIGDKALRTALDALEQIADPTESGRLRHHMAHLQLVNPADILRMKALGVTANLQALWACADAQMTELTMPILGRERSQWQYPFASIEEAGVPLAMGSDWSVSTPDPWQAIHVAINRRPPGKENFEPLVASEALTLESALEAYTLGSAALLGFPAKGIQVGEAANLALADRNPFGIPSEQLCDITNVATVIDGELWR